MDKAVRLGALCVIVQKLFAAAGLDEDKRRLRRRGEALGTLATSRALLVAEAETAPLAFDFGARETRHDLGHLDVRDALDVTASEDDVDLLERSAGGLRVEEVNDREEAQAAKSAVTSQQTVGWARRDDDLLDRAEECEGADRGRVQERRREHDNGELPGA